MSSLHNYDKYGGYFPTTAGIANALAYQGVLAPHTGKPYTEAMLMGIAGGAAFGYFTFAYQGFDPQANILTRNTFRRYGWEPVVERLGLVQDLMSSTSAEKARNKLVETLEAGDVPIVWADVFTLGYEPSELGEEMWMMIPIVVTAYEPEGEAVIADRSRAPIRVPARLLDEARGKVKKEKHRMVVLDAPAGADLPAAVRAGIEDCIELYTGAPPQGSAKNFGLTGFETWIDRLTKPGSKESWAKLFPAGRPLFAGLTTAFKYALLFWEDDTQSADRALFAEFLEEAGLVLGTDALTPAATAFAEAGRLWRELGRRLLPGDVPLLSEARELLAARHKTFREQGNAAIEELHRIDERLEELKARAVAELSDDRLAGRIREEAADAVAAIRDAEQEGVERLREGRAAIG